MSDKEKKKEETPKSYTTEKQIMDNYVDQIKKLDSISDRKINK